MYTTDDLRGPERDREDVGAHIREVNAQRLAWLIPIFTLIHLAHIAVFWPFTPGPVEDRELWRNEVLVAHVVLLTIDLLLLPVFTIVRNAHLQRKRAHYIHHLFYVAYLGGGVSLAIIDQRIMPSINPLIIAVVGLAVVLVVHPAISLLSYSLALAGILVGLAWTQSDPDLLLSARVNSITATGLGCGLAVTQWRHQITSLRQRRRIEEQQHELEVKNQELTRLASRDPLTGLLNRTQFFLEADLEITRLQHAQSSACLLMLDVDYFKKINDTFGHPAGDRILGEIAGSMSRMFGEALLSRFGGEEFAIILPGASLEEGVQAAERLRVAIAEHVFSTGGRSMRITASFGVAEIRVGHEDALEAAYAEADRALYLAKHSGRDCVQAAPRHWPQQAMS